MAVNQSPNHNVRLLQLSEDHAQQVVLQPLQKKVKKALEDWSQGDPNSQGGVSRASTVPPTQPDSPGGVASLTNMLDSPVRSALELSGQPEDPPLQPQAPQREHMRRKSLSSQRVQQLQQQIHASAGQLKQPAKKKVKKESVEAKKAGETEKVKKVKKETVEGPATIPAGGTITAAPTPARNELQGTAANPPEKRLRCSPAAAPVGQSSSQSDRSVKHRDQHGRDIAGGNSQAERSANHREQQGRDQGGNSIAVKSVARVLSEAREHLKGMVDVEGVRKLLDEFPKFVLGADQTVLFAGVPDQGLEERVAKITQNKMPRWIADMENLATYLGKSLAEYKSMARAESGMELLRRVRAAGLGFGGALQHVVSGTAGCGSTDMTLEEELMEFSAAMASTKCWAGSRVTGQEARVAAEELWSSFNGVERYTAYVRENLGMGSVDMPLNGGAAWHRLTKEIEIAMRLVHPSVKHVQELVIATVQAGGTGLRGNQDWDDIAAKLLLEIAYEPLRRRIHYVVARVSWALQQLKSSVVELMATAADMPASRMYSPLFPQHLDIVRSGPLARDLILGAFDEATSNVATKLLKHLEGTLNAMCFNPRIMRRPSTGPDCVKEILKPCQPSRARDRVKAEMALRRGSAHDGLLTSLQDLTFIPSEAEKVLPRVQKDLYRVFKVLANLLSDQTAMFADTSVLVFSNRQLDETMNAIQLSPEQWKVMDAREGELQTKVTKARNRLNKLQHCIASMKSASSTAFAQ